jgi:geranylgeranyl diphosphate synthase type I
MTSHLTYAATKDSGVSFAALHERYHNALHDTLLTAVPGTGPMTVLTRYQMGWVDQNGVPTNGGSHHGKALRPTLCLAVCEAAGGDWHRALPCAAALEIIHNFSLVHDDIQDGDTERRHRPTVWFLWGKRKGLMAGNGLLAHAMKTVSCLDTHGFSAQTQLRATAILSERCLQMIEGQYLDLSYEERLDIGVHGYIEMVKRKTGALLQGAAELGALMAECNDNTVGQMGRFGLFLGVAFQIRDDILGIWGDASVTGKAAGNDIWRRKKSYPIVFALANVEGAAKQQMQNMYLKPEIEGGDVEHVLSILENVGARERSQALAEQLAQDALKELEPVTISKWGRETLEGLVHFLVNRDH